MKMTKVNIKLNQIDDIYRFNDLVNKIPNVIDITQNRYCMSAKVIQNLFQFDLEKEVTLVIYGEVDVSHLYMLENFNNM